LSDIFWIGLREGFQASVFVSAFLLCPELRKKSRLLVVVLFLGAVTGFFMGLRYLFGFKEFLKAEWWNLLRVSFDILVLYSGLVLLQSRRQWFVWPVFLLFFFFDMREFGFVLQDTVQMKSSYGPMVQGLVGFSIGLLPLGGLGVIRAKEALEEVFTLSGTMVLVGGFRLIFSGLGQLHKEGLIVFLQKGMERFLYPLVRTLQKLLLIPEHRYIEMPFQDLGRFLYSERVAMALVVLVLVIPPVALLLNIYISPEPVVRLPKKAMARLKVAAFRQQTLLGSLPGFVVFFFVVGILHAANFKTNPMYDPVPVPVFSTDGQIVLPLEGKLGKLTDKKLHKFVYYYGKKEIVFLVILRPDGTFGVALDQCEICQPAEWNKAAEGYAQRGEHLVCKYCMTPIAPATVNNPGGCNPIPVPFETLEDAVVIKVSDIVRVFEAAEKLEKKGTHL
jgi:hypothetical protein